jgi:hypothetical protein
MDDGEGAVEKGVSYLPARRQTSGL